MGKTFADLGRVEAIRTLFNGTGYKPLATSVQPQSGAIL